jgi:phospholipid/cholesterol/gamma-HCH transport system substrate-binding protein
MVDRHVTYGLTFIALILALIVGTVASYEGVFRSTVPLTVSSDRAGLTLAPGAAVKLRGVVIGRVGSVDHDAGDGVSIQLEIDQDELNQISSDTTAEIVPPTAFGAKYIQLNPGEPGAERIQAGSTIDADRVTVEVDEAFENLTQVLDTAKPAEVAAALTAVSQAVDQRGEDIGLLITQTNGYLTSFNPYLSTLTSDIRSGASVAQTYDTARPDLVALADKAAVTSRTLTTQQKSLHAFEVSLYSFDNSASQLLDSSGRRLTTTLKLTAPVADVVERYSPELPCTILGLASANKLAEAAVGGTHPGITTITRIVPGRDPYTYERNLPKIGDTSGPECYGLPYVTEEEAQAAVPTFATGANPYAGKQPTVQENTLTTLLGLLAGGANAAGGKQ